MNSWRHRDDTIIIHSLHLSFINQVCVGVSKHTHTEHVGPVIDLTHSADRHSCECGLNPAKIDAGLKPRFRILCTLVCLDEPIQTHKLSAAVSPQSFVSKW